MVSPFEQGKLEGIVLDIRFDAESDKYIRQGSEIENRLVHILGIP